MPLYEYQCTQCGFTFERIQKFSDPLVTECPTCGGKVQQLLSVPAVHFKGTGWYVTDYSRKNTASSSPTTTASGDAAKTESPKAPAEEKPAASAPPKAPEKN